MATKNKYGNKTVVIDDITFDSAMEGKYYTYLKQLQTEGIVSEILTQKKYTLLEGFRKDGKKFLPITYLADFEVHYQDGHIEVIDVKGMVTETFAVKRKLFEYRYSHLKLRVLTFSKIDGGWIELEDLKKARKQRRKVKEAKRKHA